MPTRQGKILGIDCEITVDAGAYGMWPQGPYSGSQYGGALSARTSMRSRTTAPASPPSRPTRRRSVHIAGSAGPGACFADERTIDEIAHAIGRDPVAVRIENMIRPEQMPYASVTGMLYDCGKLPAARLCAERRTCRRSATPATRRAGRARPSVSASPVSPSKPPTAPPSSPRAAPRSFQVSKAAQRAS